MYKRIPLGVILFLVYCKMDRSLVNKIVLGLLVLLLIGAIVRYVRKDKKSYFSAGKALGGGRCSACAPGGSCPPGCNCPNCRK